MPDKPTSEREGARLRCGAKPKGATAFVTQVGVRLTAEQRAKVAALAAEMGATAADAIRAIIDRSADYERKYR